jgi:hypothetical protein
MGHSIRGFVARPETLAAVSARFPVAKLVTLDAGFAWVPATDAVVAAIDAADPAGERMARSIDFLFDHPTMLRLLADLSRAGPIAFVETDYVDGRGAQAATACVNGEVVTSQEGDGRPINHALRAIGVVRPSDEDEFDTVCLGKYRSMDAFEPAPKPTGATGSSTRG